MSPLIPRAIVAAVAANALTGILAILTGDFDGAAGRLLLTTLTLTAVGFCVLLCALAWDAGKLAFLPSFGLTTSVIGFSLVIAGIWTQPDQGDFWRLSATLAVLGATTAYACFLSLADLDGYKELRYGAIALSYVVGAVIIAGIWESGDAGAFPRAFWIAVVLLLSASLLVPVVQYFESAQGGKPIFAPPGDGLNAPPDAATPLAPSVPAEAGDHPYCPGCGAPAATYLPNLECGSCGARYRVEVVSPPRRGARAGANGKFSGTDFE